MKPDIRRLFLLGIFNIISIPALVFIFFTQGGLAAFFYGYLIIGTVLCLSKQVWAKALSSTPQGTIQSAIEAIMHSGDAVDKSIKGIHTVVQPLVEITTGFLPLFRLMVPRSRRFNTPGMLCSHPYVSISVTVFSCTIVLISHYLGLTSPHIHWMYWILLIHTWLRHLTYLTGSTNLYNSLKQSPGTPQIRFFAIAAADLVCLSVLVTAILSWNNGDAVSYQKVIAAARDILTFKGVLSMLQGEAAWNAGKLIESITGVLFTTSILKNLIQRKKFVRTSDDFAILANIYLRMGKIEQANDCLMKTEPGNEQALLTSFRHHIMEQDVYQAHEKIEKLLDKKEELKDRINSAELMAGLLTLYQLEPDTFRDFIDLCVEKEIEDVAVLNCMMIFVKRMQADPKPLLARLSSHNDPMNYPLSESGLLIHTGCYEEARELLESADFPADTEDVIHHGLLFFAQIEAKRSSLFEIIPKCEAWGEYSLPEIEKLVPSLKHSKRINTIHTQLKEIYQICSPLNVSYSQKLNAIIKDIEDNLEPNVLTAMHLHALDMLKNVT